VFVWEPHCDAWGLVSAHTYAVRALETATVIIIIIWCCCYFRLANNIPWPSHTFSFLMHPLHEGGRGGEEEGPPTAGRSELPR